VTCGERNDRRRSKSTPSRPTRPNYSNYPQSAEEKLLHIGHNGAFKLFSRHPRCGLNIETILRRRGLPNKPEL
jgi:hypothetical protein